MVATNGQEQHNSKVKIKVASLNCWGLYISKKRKERLEQIAKYLLEEQNDWDLVGLQEVWIRTDYERLADRVRSRYPFAYSFRAGVMGSGLAILSRHPIRQSFFYRYTLNGSPDRITHGDWFSGKGVAGVRVALPNSVVVDFYTTHLHAEYSRGTPVYTAHRLAQLVELFAFVEHTTLPNHVAIIAGDLNTQPHEFPYQMTIAHGVHLSGHARTIVDPWGEGSKSSGDCFTFAYPQNSFSKPASTPQRLDYILWLSSEAVKCTQSLVQTEDRPYDPTISLSDHALLKAEFEIDPEKLAKLTHPDKAAMPLTPNQRHIELVHEAIQIYQDQRKRVIWWQKFYIWVAVIMLLLFIGFTITTAVTIPNDQLTPLLILALFGVQPAVLVTLFLTLFMARVFLQEERAALEAFIREWQLWLVQHEEQQSQPQLEQTSE